MKKMIKATAWLVAAILISGFFMPITPASAAPVYKYEWVSQSGTVSPDGYAHQYTNLVAGQTINLSLTLINRSGTTIKGRSSLPYTPGYQVPIGTWGVGSQTPYQDGSPDFLDRSSFILNNNRYVYYEGGDVPDGGYLSLNWTVKLSDDVTDGIYDMYYRPVCEYLAWTRQVKNGQTLPGTNSDIFTRLVVGSGYKTYTNTDLGYVFDYPNLGGDATASSIPVPIDSSNPYRLWGISGKRLSDNSIWLPHPIITAVKEVVRVSYGGDPAKFTEPAPAGSAPKEMVYVEVFNEPFDLFFNNLEFDSGIRWSYSGAADTMVKSSVSTTPQGLNYFTITGRNVPAGNVLTGKYYVIEFDSELASGTTIIIRADAPPMPNSVDTPFTLSILNSLQAMMQAC
ncbi:MAG: hypothetical protein V1807_02890, partial [Patescibacteria group bacterium]